MKKIKAFFYIFKNSLLSIPYYKDLVKENLKFSFKYFFTLTFLASVLITLYTLIPLIPEVKTLTSDAIEQILEIYPDDLIITAENATLTINQPEPYAIPLPEDLRSTLELDFENLVVFDSEGTIDDLEMYNTIALVNDKNFIFREDTGGIRAEPLGQIPEGEFGEDDLREFVDGLSGLIAALPYLIGIVMFLSILFFYAVVNLLFVLITAVIVYVLGLILKLHLPFAKYYMIALHTFTLSLIIQILIDVVSTLTDNRFEEIPYMFFAIHLIYSGIVIYALSQNKPVSISEETTSNN